jgi:hypothetical protein
VGPDIVGGGDKRAGLQVASLLTGGSVGGRNSEGMVSITRVSVSGLGSNPANKFQRQLLVRVLWNL